MTAASRLRSKAVKKAMAHQQAGRLRDAERLFRSALQDAPDDPDANHGLGLIAVGEGNAQAALPFLSAALRADPREDIHWLSFAQALLLTGATADARAVLAKAAARGNDGPAFVALRLRIDIAELHRHALDHYRAGNLPEAERLSAGILAADAAHRDSLHLLAAVAAQTARAPEAMSLCERALALDADDARAHDMLGALHLEAGNADAALTHCRQAGRLQPGNAVAHNNLGNILKSRGDLAGAITAYETAVQAAPGWALAHSNFGSALHDCGRAPDAVACLEEALRLDPDLVAARYNIALALTALKRHDEARVHVDHALALRPDFAPGMMLRGDLHERSGDPHAALACYREAAALGGDAAKPLNNAGAVLLNLGRFDDAIAHLEEALALRPDFAEAHNNLGNAWREKNELDRALRHYQDAVRLRPADATALSNLAGLLKMQGKVAEAIATYESAIANDPGHVAAHNNLIMLLAYSPDVPHERLVAQTRVFDAQVTAPLRRTRAFHNDRDAGRRLRIGYVSGDFRKHAVSYFFEPLMRHHDHDGFEITAYSNSYLRDAVTERIAAHADRWREIRHLDDDALADLIETDGIDILVDLSGHMAANRLLAFARKPAPVQATWLGFTTTTGVSAIDYRITDASCDPPGLTEHLNTETLWRLPRAFCCYEGVSPAPQTIDHPPRDDNGYVTFGCFNNFTKVTDAVLARWGEILRGAPDARLLLEIVGIDGAAFRAETLARLTQLGVPCDRVILEPRRPENHCVLYNTVDIALDPFPFNGGTTTLDALFMGVPVIALAGAHFTSRMGVTILTHAGLPEMVAQTQDDYVARAVQLACDSIRLREVRRGLRQRVMASTMFDHAAFARDIEDAYRGMWRRWCAT